MKKYERGIEILTETGKINLDFIEDIDEFVKEIEEEGLEYRIDNGYLILVTE